MSVNLNALRLVEELCEGADYYRVEVKEHPSGAKVIDSGIKAKGGLLAGRLITEIALGGLGEVEVTTKSYGEGLKLPSISITTDHPAIATLGSQLAGWRVKVGGYTAIGSGPARALALKPKSIYREIEYRDEADVAILILEASEEPPDDVFGYVSDLCGVKPSNLYLIMVPTSSAAGFIQVSGRIVEVGMHKL
ncbi:methenyltetrahydromethanopterin cyclohydrolase, partial [Candidatus Bathyarchaeota archaeon]